MKRALVTGGSGTIGSAICQVLAKKGHHLYVHGCQQLDRAQHVVQKIINDGGTGEVIGFDVTKEASVREELEKILMKGPIQILVHAAGIYDDVPMAGMTGAQWHRVLDVSLTGFFNVTQPLLLPMIRTRWGRIISLSSVSALLGNKGQTNYAAAKSGLHGAAKALAVELGPRGITVNVVAPGVIESSGTREIFSQKQIEELIPVKRMGTPQEVASLVGFLASEEAGYISGQVINISGGMPG